MFFYKWRKNNKTVRKPRCRYFCRTQCFFALRFLYDLVIRFYSGAVSIAALWNNKAAQWKSGRKNLWAELEKTFSNPHDTIWVHSASAGEFEQAKPVIEALKKQFSEYKILATFFSPSGYAVGKKFAPADFVFYLPLDTKSNAQKFVETVQPKLAVFVKYDFWYHHLKTVRDRNIPLLLISAIFRKEQPFFKPYGGFYLSILRRFTHLFVQDEASHGLLKKFGIGNCTIAGDTRFDRVLAIAKKFQPVDFIQEFCGAENVVVAGSTWPEDERFIQAAFKKIGNAKLIIAPHEITGAHVKNLTQLFQKSILYSQLNTFSAHEVLKKLGAATVLIVDNVGMLSRLYNYATITYIGGGFARGIHNTLEAAVWGKPVIFGPNYKKFREARDLIACGGAFTHGNEQELEDIMKRLLGDKEALEKSSAAAAGYVKRNTGTTQKILDFIQEKRLLTN